jgi:hypothetical protein
MRPWQNEEEVVLIIEAIKHGRGYFAVVDFALDHGVDIQEVADEIVFMPLPEPVNDARVVRWSAATDANVVGYSVYRDDERLNEKVMTEREYVSRGDIVVKPVIRGGFETVYSAHQATEMRPRTQTSTSYTFTVNPNPFSKLTTISFSIGHSVKSVELKIYDVTGKLVKEWNYPTIKQSNYPTIPQSNQIIWNGTDEQGRRVSSGVYFITCEAEGFKETEKLLLIK